MSRFKPRLFFLAYKYLNIFDVKLLRFAATEVFSEVSSEELFIHFRPSTKLGTQSIKLTVSLI